MKREIVTGVIAGLLLSTLLAVSSPPARLGAKRILELHIPSSSLRQLCRGSQWRSGLWLQCHSGHMIGGLNNARNRIQTCVRLAIDAGTGVILPPISLRDSTALKNLRTDSLVCSSSFWDTTELIRRTRAACPQLPVRDCKHPRDSWPRWTGEECCVEHPDVRVYCLLFDGASAVAVDVDWEKVRNEIEKSMVAGAVSAMTTK